MDYFQNKGSIEMLLKTQKLTAVKLGSDQYVWLRSKLMYIIHYMYCMRSLIHYSSIIIYSYEQIHK